MPSIISVLAFSATLAALVSAVPFSGHSHGHAHLHARALTERNYGQCGGDSGVSCGPGYCCSPWGYCGKSFAYCGNGCQSDFGTCHNSTTSGNSSDVAAQALQTTTLSLVSSETTTVATVTETTSSLATVTANQAWHSHSAWTGGWSSWTAQESSSTAAPAETSSAAAPSAYTSSAAAPPPSAYSSPAESSAAAPSTTLLTSTLPSAATTYVPTATYSPSTSSAAAAPTTTSAPAAPSSYSAPAASSTSASGGSSSGLGDTYKMYTGDGSTAAGWPAQSSWIDWESMWSNNMDIISISCTQFGQANNSPEESADIKSAIESVAGGIGMDPRFVLAITMQESKGCVRAPTTNYGVTNPGLMQSHDGTGSCNNGAVQDPCPSSEITQMIKDGTTGTAAGDGLEQTMSESGASDVSKYYKAARIYNSGSIASSGDLGAGIATHCYSSDIANRLTGWVKAASTCTLD